MTYLTWNKIACGYYETTNRAFQAIHVKTCYGNNEWRLMQRNDDVSGNWEYCQTFNLLRDAKEAAQAIFDELYVPTALDRLVDIVIEK